MKLTLERSALLRTLGHVQSVVERKNTIPILSNVLIRAESGQVSFTATDMDIEMLETMPAEVELGGAITASAHTLYDIVRKLPDGSQISLVTEGTGGVTITAGRSKFRLGCLPVEDFPQMAGGELAHRFQLSAADLKTLIDRTKFAISTEETRYYLNGIYIHAGVKKENGNLTVLRAVATDGHRLARVEMPSPAGADGIPGVIIPRKTVLEMRKLLDEAAGSIEISLSENKIRFSFDTVQMTSKLIDGTFPEYERVIPVGNDKIMEVPSRVFANAVDRVATISTEKSRAVKLSLSKSLLTLSASSSDAGSATEELEVQFDAPSIDIGFNARYLLDITQQIEGDTVRFTLADSGSPTIVQDVADLSALYVLMPMRV
jgi:DNA polymerase III subunit beta